MSIETPHPHWALRREALDLTQPVGDSRLALFGADRDAVSVDELGRDTEEAEHAFQIGFDMLHRAEQARFDAIADAKLER